MPIASLTPGILYHQLVISAEQEHAEVPIKVPKDVEEEYDPMEYPHWTVFQNIHLGQAFDHASLYCNAKIIAEIPEDEICLVTPRQLENKGVVLLGGRWD